MTTEQAQQYIRAIRSVPKRQYAESYFRHLTTGTASPERPENLSYMAAQAVRLELSGMLESELPFEGTDPFGSESAKVPF